ncbi:MAG TPA: hypothetical protein PJ994_01125, partial [Tepidiformaceae bacterium]|nr:hypothetical protein [Tepidiformaceae bacterium]
TRQDAATSISAVLAKNIRLCARITNTLVKDKAIEDDWRKFARPISARNLANQVEDEVVDALLAGLDALRVLADEVVTRIDSGIETARLEADLHAVLEEHDEATPAGVAAGPARSYQLPEDGVAAATQEAEGGAAVYLVELTIAPECQLPSIRCFQALQELDSLGKLLVTWPSRDAIEAGAAEFELGG